MATDNVTILDRVWLNSTNDFQQRIPRPTQQTLSSTINALFDPVNRHYYNQFVDNLIMRIGMTYVHQQQWRNPLAVFKKGKLNYGATVQEIALRWIKGHSYKDDVEDVFKMHRPKAEVWYHSQNRRDQYAMTVNSVELRSAFTADNGINEFVAQCMKQSMNADEYDEYRIMLELIAFYENKFGFYKHKLSGKPSDDATGKEFLKAIRTYAGKLEFPNTVYNGVRLPDLPVFTKRSELVLFTTPEIAASVDVDTLSAVFNLDKAEAPVRQVIVDEFPLSDSKCVALLTTKDFFQCRDTVYQTDSIYNPKTMGSNYFLNHWGVYSVSPFVPAIMFTLEDATNTTTVKQTVTGVTLTPSNTTAKAGGTVELKTELQGSLSDTNYNVAVAPDSCTFELTRTTAAGESARVGSTTYVDEYAVLHLSKNLNTGDVIKIVAKATYINPSEKTEEFSAETSVTVE